MTLLLKLSVAFQRPLLLAGVTLITSQLAQAQSFSSSVVPGRSLGKICLGYTAAQVHRFLGKPSKTLRLKNGLTDDVYRAKKTQLNPNGDSVRDKVEVLYKAGRVVQLEATSPAFFTKSELSIVSTVSALLGSSFHWRVLVYGYDSDDSGWQNYYLMDQRQGLTFEFRGWQEQLMRRSYPTTLIIHRSGSRVIPDVGGKLVTDSLDTSVVMSPYDD